MSSESTDCLECRLASGGGLIGGSIYVIHHSKKFQSTSRYLLLGVGSSLGLLGVLRLFSLPPFRHTSNGKEEYKDDLGDEDHYIIGKLPSKFQ